MKKMKIYRNIYRFSAIFLILSFVALATIFLLFQSTKNTYVSDINNQAEYDIRSFSNVFLEEMSQLSTDIFLITDLINIHDSLVLEDASTKFTSINARELIETEFLTWLGMKQTYDQIRIIDNTGQEIVRANFNNGSPSVVTESQLQDKSNRYYFTESIVLNNRELYMSVLDLNVENGEIELVNGETKPMLRVSTPIFNHDGEKLGIVIINYLARELFNKLDSTKIAQNAVIEIINEDGYYLYSDNAIEFAFMYEDLLEETYSKYHEYNIFSTQSGEITTADDQGDFFTSIRLSSAELTDASKNPGNEDIRIEFGTKEFIIFTEVDINYDSTYLNLRATYTAIAIAIVIVSIIIARLIDESIYLNNESIKRMRFDSLHDLLTTLPNRKNIYEQIAYQIQRERTFTLLFIDFDEFKNVNDQYGHDVGDDVLIEGSKRIRNSIRFDDVLGRIGGDEFICLLKDLTDQEIVSRVCKNIIDTFNKPFDIIDKPIRISISIGAFSCPENRLSIDEIIRKADQAMYEVKKSGKNNFIIFSK